MATFQDMDGGMSMWAVTRKFNGNVDAMFILYDNYDKALEFYSALVGRHLMCSPPITNTEILNILKGSLHRETNAHEWEDIQLIEVEFGKGYYLD